MRQWLRRRAAGRAPAAPGSAPPGAGQPVGPVDRLGVDVVPVPVRQRFEPFQQDVRAGRLALLRTEFRTFSAPTREDPLFRLAESDVGNVADLTSDLRAPARAVGGVMDGRLEGRSVPSGGHSALGAGRALRDASVGWW